MPNVKAVLRHFACSLQLTRENKKSRKERSKNNPPDNKVLIVLSRKAKRSISSVCEIRFLGVSSGNLVLWITGGLWGSLCKCCWQPSCPGRQVHKESEAAREKLEFQDLCRWKNLFTIKAPEWAPDHREGMYHIQHHLWAGINTKHFVKMSLCLIFLFVFLPISINRNQELSSEGLQETQLLLIKLLSVGKP